MSNARTYTRNLSVNMGGHIATLTVMFFLSPFVVNTLGLTAYGVWSLLNVLTGYMGLCDLGVRASTGRYVILYVGKKDQKRVNETIRTALGLYSFAGALLLVVAFVLGWFFPRFFTGIPPEYHGLVRLLLPLMAINLWLTTCASVFSSVLAAHDRFDLARGVDVALLVVRTAATVAVLKLGYGLLGLVAVTVATGVAAFVLNLVVVRKIYRPFRPWPPKIDRRSLRELISYGVAAFISAVAIQIIGQTDHVVVGAAISVAAVTAYSVGSMLVYYSQTLTNQITTTFFPPVQRALARGEKGAARWLFFRQVRLGLLVGVPLYVGFIIYGKAFIRLWMLGPEFPEASVEVAAVVMAVLAGSKLLSVFLLGWGPLLNAMGYVSYTAGVSICEAIANLVLTLVFVLVLDWGLPGVALGTLVARFAVPFFLLPWYGARKAQIHLGNYYVRIGGAGLVAASLFAAWCLFVRAAFPIDSWLSFFTQVGVALLGYIPIALWVVLPKADRKRVWGVLARATV